MKITCWGRQQVTLGAADAAASCFSALPVGTAAASPPMQESSEEQTNTCLSASPEGSEASETHCWLKVMTPRGGLGSPRGCRSSSLKYPAPPALLIITDNLAKCLHSWEMGTLCPEGNDTWGRHWCIFRQGRGRRNWFGSDERQVRIPLISQRIQVQRKIWNWCMGKNISQLFISVRVVLFCVCECVCERPVLGLLFMLRPDYIELLVHQLWF